MPEFIRRISLKARDDRGSTLIELTIAAMLMLLFLGMVYQVLFSTQNVVGIEMDRSETLDEVRLAITQIERQVRSGNLFYDPVNEATPGMAFRVYTQANAPSNPDYPNRCVQWRVHEGTLETRQWEPNWSEGKYATSFRAVAQSVVNVERGTTAFTLDQSQPQFGRRLLKIVLLTNTDEKSGSDARVEVSITGRNTGFGFPDTSCEDAPPHV